MDRSRIFGRIVSCFESGTSTDWVPANSAIWVATATLLGGIVIGGYISYLWSRRAMRKQEEAMSKTVLDYADRYTELKKRAEDSGIWSAEKSLDG
jgi:hypothetical protein